MPRIFISYRRADSRTITGRIHDHLEAAFTGDNVFKDVNDIPAGADFRKVIYAEVAKSDVVLAIIGPDWTGQRENDEHNRLKNPDDFVRIELEAALSKDDVLLIPVMVRGATFPAPGELPDSLQPLLYRNALSIRDDPDFNRDIKELILQIKQHTKSETRRWPLRLIAAGLLFLLVAALGGFMLIQQFAGSGRQTDCEVQPVADNEYMVLVTQPEPINTQRRDIARFVADNLSLGLEQEVNYSNVRVRQCDTIITSADEARETAQSTGTAVIVWGNYDNSRVELEIQAGALDAFKHIEFPRELLENTVNVRVRLQNEREESVAPQVLSVLGLLHFADGNIYEMTRNLAAVDDLTTVSSSAITNSVAARVSRAFVNFVSDTPQALVELDAAVAQNVQNPLLYGLRGFAYQRQGDIEVSSQDIRSALQLAPANWSIPYFLQSFNAYFNEGDFAAAAQESAHLIELRPDDWYVYFWHGQILYFWGDYAEAQAASLRAIELQAPNILPYTTAIGASAHLGDLIGGAQLMKNVFDLFPDPEAGNRILGVIFSQEENRYSGLLGSIYGNLLLGQDRRVLEELERVIAVNDQLPDVYYLRALAYCSLGNFAEAEAALSQAIEIEPDYPLLYVTRADVRQRSGDLAGALADFNQAMQSYQGSQLTPYLSLAQAGALNVCEDLSNPDLIDILNQVAETASP